MNIRQTMPAKKEIDLAGLSSLSPEALNYLVIRRRDVYAGFAEIEQAQVHASRVWASLSSKNGQDLARGLWARCLEEVLESVQSTTREHWLEELIDAFNYLLSILVFDPVVFSLSREDAEYGLGKKIYHYFHWWKFKGSKAQEKPNLGDSEFQEWLLSCDSFLSKLRNRSWQNSVQSAYFDGTEELVYMCGGFLAYIIRFFESWEEFAAYYLAKESVLTFRLETKY